VIPNFENKLVGAISKFEKYPTGTILNKGKASENANQIM
jgi:hypothetical protein